MKTLISIGLIFTSLAIYSQNKFSSIQVGEKYTRSQIKSAINKANWCGYYHETGNCELVFDDGAKIYLKSKEQLIGDEQKWIEKCKQFTKVAGQQTFSITENGVIVIRASIPSIKSKTIKY